MAEEQRPAEPQWDGTWLPRIVGFVMGSAAAVIAFSAGEAFFPNEAARPSGELQIVYPTDSDL